MIILFSFACQSEKEIEPDYQAIYAIFEENGFEVDGINTSIEEGFRLQNTFELETYLKFVNEGIVDEITLESILKNNNIIASELSQFKNQTRILPKAKGAKIQCLHNPQSLYLRVNSGNPLARVDVTFQVGSGSGTFENFDATLGGITAGLSLGKNSFNQVGYANPSNNFTYTGIFYFSIRYSLFVEGIGTIYTTDVRQFRIRVNGCNGVVHTEEMIP